MNHSAYSVVYEATRAGARQRHLSFFKSATQVSTAEEFAGMINEISRQAVSRGHANSIDDVSITSVSLLNPTAAVEGKESTQQRETGSQQGDKDGYIANLETAFIDCYLLAVKSSKGSVIENRYGRMYDDLSSAGCD